MSKGFTKKTNRVLVIFIMILILAPTTAIADSDGSKWEIGLSGVGDYSAHASGHTHPNLNTALDCVSGLKGIVNDPSSSWKTRYSMTNVSVWETDFKDASLGGADGSYADNVDLAAYCGHGDPKMNLELSYAHSSCFAKLSNMRLGDKDCEWFLAFTCNFLNGTKDQIGVMAKGIHAICGFASSMTVTKNGGERFVNQACGLKLPVTASWIEYAKQTQIGYSATAAYFVAKNNNADRLYGFGTMKSDPAAYSSSTKSNYELTTVYIY